MTQILQPNIAQSSSIIVQTRLGTPVENYQIYEFSHTEQNQFELIRKIYKTVIYRTQPSPIFNCHGLVFASRRTGIYADPAITLCLREDNYSEISRDDVLPGDVIMYYADNGDIEHSGLVISPPDLELHIPKVLSKWGRFCEVVHWAHICPYLFANAKYYRLNE